jgi:hypothetical protein
MAYMNQEKKAIINAKMQPILKKYKVKATLSVDNHSTINLNIKSSAFDFVGIYNKYLEEQTTLNYPNETYTKRENFKLTHGWVDDYYSGVELQFFKEAFAALQSAGYYNNTDAQTDYFDTAYYFYINVGQWDKPYQQTKGTI